MKVGDSVICIDNNSSLGHKLPLTVGKSYIIQHIDKNCKDIINVINDSDYKNDYFTNKFITINNYRKKKLEKLNNIS